MIITKDEVGQLQKKFASLFNKKYLITMGMPKHPVYGLVVMVRVDVLNGAGSGEEFLTLDFASKLLREPKELEQYYLRWERGFAAVAAGPQPTLTLN